MLNAMYSMFCDINASPNCTGWCGEVDTKAEARDMAKRDGWTRKRWNGRIVDVCPSCAVLLS